MRAAARMLTRNMAGGELRPGYRLVGRILIQEFGVVGAVNDSGGDDLLLRDVLAVQDIDRHIDRVTHHGRAVQRRLQPDVLVLGHHAEVFLHTAAACEDFDVGAVGLADGLQRADGGLIVHRVDCIDVVNAGEDIRHVFQAVFAGELGSVSEDLQVGSDLGDRLNTARLSQFRHRTSSSYFSYLNFAISALLVYDIMCTIDAHELVLKYDTVHTRGIDHDLEFIHKYDCIYRIPTGIFL